MSYILEALKKAEQERRLGPRSAFEPVRAEPPRARPRTWPWPAVLAGALLLLAGVGAVALWRSGPTGTAKPAPAPPVEEAREVPAAAAAALPAALPPVIPRSEDTPAASPARPARPSPRPRPPAAPSRPSVASAPARPEARTPPVPTPRLDPGAPGEKPAAPAGPASGEGMPRLKLEVHVYSESPSARMVFINGRKYVEGDRVEDKYLLEQITRDGVTLAHQGQRVRLVP